MLEKLPLKQIWKNCSNTETVFYSATNLPAPEGFNILYALQEHSEDLLLYSVPLGSLPTHQ